MKTIKFPASVLALSLAILATPAVAIPLAWNAGTGTWTTPSNWTPNQVPTGADDVTVNNGGTANQTGLPISTNDLTIGNQFPFGPTPPGGTGTVNLTNGNATINRDLKVGVSSTTVGLFSPANGTFTTSGGLITPGDVFVNEEISIGVFIIGPSGSATGLVDIQNGDLTGSDNDFQPDIGLTRDGGNADGTLNVAGNVSLFGQFTVGQSSGSGDATGEMNVGGTYRTDGLVVGRVLGSGMADGTFEIGNKLSTTFATIGASGIGSNAAAIATGELTVSSGGLEGRNDEPLSIGLTQGLGNAFGTATVTGGVFGFEDVDVGVVAKTDRSGFATGVLSVLSGGITGENNQSDLKIGTTIGDGSADGTVTVQGGVSEFEEVSIGVVETNASGNATGVLDINSGDFTGTDNDFQPNIGVTRGSGDADGTLNVAGNVSLYGQFTVGQSSDSGNATGDMTVGGSYRADGLAIGRVFGSGMADGTVEIGSNLRTRFAVVGASGINSGGAAVATGALTVLSGGIEGPSDDVIAIGLVRGLGHASGTATITGGVTEFEDVEVGFVNMPGPTGDATGILNVLSGGIIGENINSDLTIGTTNGSGDADGTVMVQGGVSEFEEVSVGVVRPGASGDATGILDIKSGNLTGTDNDFQPNIGVTRGSGDADGTLNVAGNVSLYGQFTVGQSSDSGDATGEMNVGGTYRTDGLVIGRVFGSGMADGTFEIGDALRTTFAAVGASGIGSNANAIATGEFTVLSGGVTSGGDEPLAIGLVQGLGNAFGTANITGSVTGFEDVEVGLVTKTDRSGFASGVLNIWSGGLAGESFINNNDLSIGRTFGDGSAVGIAMVNGGVSNFENAYIGFVENAAEGNATGALDLINGDMIVQNLIVGTNAGPGEAIGRLDVNDNLLTVTDNAAFGNGSTLAFNVDGVLRGIDFGAADVGFAILSGILELNFSFQPVAGIFDFIISDTVNGLLSDFDDVFIYGLNPGTLATYGVVVDGGVARWRLEIGQGGPIPAPPPRPDPPMPPVPPGTTPVDAPSPLPILLSAIAIVVLAQRWRKATAG